MHAQKENVMNTPESAAYYLFERLHAGQPAKDIVLDDWTLSGSFAAQKVAECAEHVGCDVGDILTAATAIIAQDAAEYAASDEGDNAPR